MICVDPLMNHGWVIWGKATQSCHMFSRGHDQAELHRMAEKVGLERRYFQDREGFPHYDLTPRRRVAVILKGAKAMSSAEFKDWLRRMRLPDRGHEWHYHHNNLNGVTDKYLSCKICCTCKRSDGNDPPCYGRPAFALRSPKIDESQKGV